MGVFGVFFLGEKETEAVKMLAKKHEVEEKTINDIIKFMLDDFKKHEVINFTIARAYTKFNVKSVIVEDIYSTFKGISNDYFKKTKN